jgi:catalase
MNQIFYQRRHGLRLAFTSVALSALIAVHPLATGGTEAEQTSPGELVDAMNHLFGKQTTGRAIHAKGIVLEGTFEPAPEAAGLSKAPHLNGKRVPVLVRFSSFAGIPTISDTDGLASPRGLAIKFQVPGNGETDIVSHSFNGFPTATAAEFTQLLQALGASGPGTPAPTPADQFLASHPVAKTFLTTQAPPPASFATMRYYGVNSFRFTNAAGQSRFGRYQLVPMAGEQSLSKQQLAGTSKDYLEQEIGSRVAGAPVRFVLQVQVAEAGDRIDDPSIAWPASRPVVKLGELSITRLVPDSDGAEQRLMFTPTAVADGIEPADPMIAMRGASYGLSYGRRHTH